MTSRIWEVCFTITDREIKLCLSAVKTTEVTINTTLKCACLGDCTTPTVVGDDRHVVNKSTLSIFQPDGCSNTRLLNRCHAPVGCISSVSVGCNVGIDAWEVRSKIKFTNVVSRLSDSGDRFASAHVNQVTDKESVDLIVRITTICDVKTVDVLRDSCTEARIFQRSALQEDNLITHTECVRDASINNCRTKLQLVNIGAMDILVKLNLCARETLNFKDVVSDATVDNITSIPSIANSFNVNRDTTTVITCKRSRLVGICFSICLNSRILVKQPVALCECTFLDVNQHARIEGGNLSSCAAIVTNQYSAHVNHARDSNQVNKVFAISISLTCL